MLLTGKMLEFDVLSLFKKSIGHYRRGGTVVSSVTTTIIIHFGESRIAGCYDCLLRCCQPGVTSSIRYMPDVRLLSGYRTYEVSAFPEISMHRPSIVAEDHLTTESYFCCARHRKHSCQRSLWQQHLESRS